MALITSVIQKKKSSRQIEIVAKLAKKREEKNEQYFKIFQNVLLSFQFDRRSINVVQKQQLFIQKDTTSLSKIVRTANCVQSKSDV